MTGGGGGGGGGGVKSHVPVNSTLSYWQCLLSYTTACLDASSLFCK